MVSFCSAWNIAAHPKQTVKHSQERTKQSVKQADREGFGQRLREAFKGAINAEIARKLGITEAGAKNYLDGRIPPADMLIVIRGLTGCSVDWLLTGEGAKWTNSPSEVGGESLIYFGEGERKAIKELATENERTFDEQVRELVLESLISRGLITDQVEGANLIFFGEHVPNLVSMKLLGEIAAGAPIDVFEYDESVLVAEDFVMPNRENFVLRVKGDSMTDEGIHDGDLIICYESATANNGDTVVALIDGDKATVKKFYKERGRIRLQPKNRNHKPILIEPERVKIQGIVIGIQRRT